MFPIVRSAWRFGFFSAITNISPLRGRATLGSIGGYQHWPSPRASCSWVFEVIDPFNEIICVALALGEG